MFSLGSGRIAAKSGAMVQHLRLVELSLTTTGSVRSQPALQFCLKRPFNISD